MATEGEKIDQVNVTNLEKDTEQAGRWKKVKTRVKGCVKTGRAKVKKVPRCGGRRQITRNSSKDVCGIDRIRCVRLDCRSEVDGVHDVLILERRMAKHYLAKGNPGYFWSKKTGGLFSIIS